MDLEDDFVCKQHNQKQILICTSCPQRPRCCVECCDEHSAHNFVSLKAELQKQARFDETLVEWADLDKKIQ